jgi:hypothetical protein
MILIQRRLQLRHYNLETEVGWLARQGFLACHPRYKLRGGAVGILVQGLDIVDNNSCDVAEHFLGSIATSSNGIHNGYSACLDNPRAPAFSCFVVRTGTARVWLMADCVRLLHPGSLVVGVRLLHPGSLVVGVRVGVDLICILHLFCFIDSSDLTV